MAHSALPMFSFPAGWRVAVIPPAVATAMLIDAVGAPFDSTILLVHSCLMGLLPRVLLPERLLALLSEHGYRSTRKIYLQHCLNLPTESLVLS